MKFLTLLLMAGLALAGCSSVEEADRIADTENYPEDQSTGDDPLNMKDVESLNNPNNPNSPFSPENPANPESPFNPLNESDPGYIGGY